jgi:hypothetical protein
VLKKQFFFRCPQYFSAATARIIVLLLVLQLISHSLNSYSQMKIYRRELRCAASFFIGFNKILFSRSWGAGQSVKGTKVIGVRSEAHFVVEFQLVLK